MCYDRIRVAIITPTREMANNFLKYKLGAAYPAGKEYNTPRLIYENSLMEFLWVGENNLNVLGMRFHMVFCTKEVRTTKWFNDYIKPCLLTTIGEITEEDLNEISNGQGGLKCQTGVKAV